MSTSRSLLSKSVDELETHTLHDYTHTFNTLDRNLWYCVAVHGNYSISYTVHTQVSWKAYKQLLITRLTERKL